LQPSILLAAFFVAGAAAQSGENVLVVVNARDETSRQIGAYYRVRRVVPARNVCQLDTAPDEEISWQVYESRIEQPVARCLERAGLREKVLYIVTTRGVPLKVSGGGSGWAAEQCAVDSELALLYAKMKGTRYARGGGVPNPFFKQRDAPFGHPRFPIYLVTRLAAYDLADMKAMVDRALAARNRGKFVIDMASDSDEGGDGWLRTAAILLPAARVVLDEGTRVLYDQHDVIGYAGWGSNDGHRTRRFLGFTWLPGAIATEFVSTNARTFARPPDNWTPTTWQDKAHWFAGSPQSLAADYIHEGATGCSGHVYEPYLTQTPRPDYLLPAYYGGRNLAESYYLAIPSLSWQNVVLGDPLCRLGQAP
jgi:uncharacterized protein (TIGR03790 family)